MQHSRETYNYIPAHLVRTCNATSAAIAFGGLTLEPSIPKDWPKNKENAKFQSSRELDNFHQKLLQSESEEDLLHGILSVNFWGYASGSNGIVNEGRALARCRFITHGRAFSSPQDTREISEIVKKSRFYLKTNTQQALKEIMKLRQFGMSFGSKILMFMDPDRCAVYDAVISARLFHHSDSELSCLHVKTSGVSIIKQAQVFEAWCKWCINKAEELNLNNSSWRDWSGAIHTWRCVDVERAFFALGRGKFPID